MGNNAVSVRRSSFRGIRTMPSADGAGQRLFVGISVRSDKTCAESLRKRFVSIYTNTERSATFHFIFSSFDFIFTNARRKCCGFFPFGVKQNRSNGFSIGEESSKVRCRSFHSGSVYASIRLSVSVTFSSCIALPEATTRVVQ